MEVSPKVYILSKMTGKKYFKYITFVMLWKMANSDVTQPINDK